ncbi:hypothetical protein [Pontivivens ytuae]|nr:hypothetical protein [Pontivivens ytuae]
MLSGFIAINATLAGVTLGLAAGTALAVGAHGAMLLDPRSGK